ncbi:MAG: polyphosphate kinase 1 [Spirochaeta sp.]|jgi:polyphosphate kinase|nr:polyphosphate kinase 1 [Spirochaeta sp.]
MSARFFNRELSWIEFNARVLAEAESQDVPLLERLKFLSIVSANFDEFFMVRVASVKRQIRRGKRSSCPTGMSPREQLEAIQRRVAEITEQKYQVLLEDVFPALEREGISRVRPQEWDGEQQGFVRHFFRDRVFPVLTPVRATIGEPLQSIGNLRLHAAFLLSPETETRESRPEEGDGPFLVVVQVPASLERVVYLPTEKSDTLAFTFLEQVILAESYQLFPGYTVTDQCLFRVTRDADFGVDEERDEDFMEAMEQVIETRDFSDAVRLNINQGSPQLRQILTEAFELTEGEVYETPDPLELRNLMDIAGIDGYNHLRDEPWKNLQSPWVDEDESMWGNIQRRDILLHHPYESFDPVVRLVQEAATDKDTLAIKMTLYRTSGNSPIVKALERAAENGKQVSVLVELKARFDEERNIGWAQQLERAGVIVVYGIARLKVHAKALMVVRRERSGIKRYVHLGTGNYNDKTARLYTDLGLLTADDQLAYEVGLFFNAITGYSVIPGLKKLSLAPIALKNRVLELIQRETSRAKSSGTGLIIAKMNSLADPDVIEALYEASQSGVEIRLNVRGICMLVPGVPGMSETIRVVSVIDRYLEHSRVFRFENGGHPETYLGSADWMPRNLEKRVELMFPVENRDIQRRIRKLLDLYFEDNCKAHELASDGSWTRVQPHKTAPRVRTQEIVYQRIRERLSGDEPENRQEFKVRRRPPE